MFICHKMALRFFATQGYHNRPAQDHGDVPLGLKTQGGQGRQAVGAHVLVHTVDGQGGWVLVLFPTATGHILVGQGGRLLCPPTVSLPRPLTSTPIGAGPTILGPIPSPRLLPLLPPAALSLLIAPSFVDAHLGEVALVQAPCLFLGPLWSVHFLPHPLRHGGRLQPKKHNKCDAAEKLHARGGGNDVMMLVV